MKYSIYSIPLLLIWVPVLLFGDTPLNSKHIAGGFSKPIYLTSAGDESKRLFVAEQAGKIHIIKNGIRIPEPFLDITDRIHQPRTPGDERGLLGLAFHPDYSTNGYFYLNYVDMDSYTIIARFSTTGDRDIADPTSEKILIKLKQPYSNHNGGMLAFGPGDGYLYIGLGDGGKWGDPHNNAQRLDNLLGKILRIDVDHGEPYAIPPNNPFIDQGNARPEIWVYGLRNPWRFSFDQATGDLYIGDVGQNRWEEINFLPVESMPGVNLGWRIMEGLHCYNPETDCDTSGLIKPVLEYPNNANYSRVLLGFEEEGADGCSVTGGYVYRGSGLPHLRGTYLFGDYCSGNIWSFTIANDQVTQFKNLTEEINLGGGEFTYNISSFGEDEDGELYIVDYNGDVYKLVPGP